MGCDEKEKRAGRKTIIVDNHGRATIAYNIRDRYRRSGKATDTSDNEQPAFFEVSRKCQASAAADCAIETQYLLVRAELYLLKANEADLTTVFDGAIVVLLVQFVVLRSRRSAAEHHTNDYDGNAPHHLDRLVSGAKASTTPGLVFAMFAWSAMFVSRFREIRRIDGQLQRSYRRTCKDTYPSL
jgi:hypothetical protein